MSEIQDEVTTKKLRIVDDNGRTRISLSTFGDGFPLIELYDDSNKKRASLGYDPTNTREVSLRIGTGTDDLGGINVRVDVGGRTSIDTGDQKSYIQIITSNGAPVITLTGHDGRSQVVLRVRDGQLPELMLLYKGEILWRMPEPLAEPSEGTTVQ